MHKLIILAFAFLALNVLQAQTIKPLLSINFDSCQLIDDSEFNRTIDFIGTPECVCSPDGQGIQFNAFSPSIVVEDSSLVFKTAFTISFLMKPNTASTNPQRIISWKNTCTQDNGLSITYDGSDHSLSFELYDNLTNRLFFVQRLPENECWYSVVLQKSGSRVILYINGLAVREEISPSTLSLQDLGRFEIGSGPCVPGFVSAFEGVLDRIEVYNDFTTIAQIEREAVRKNRILTRDTLVFLGRDVQIELKGDCGTAFQWQPTLDVDDPNAPNPIISPKETEFYSVNIIEAGCVLRDTIRIIVVDSSQVTCEKLVLPTAFTPNNDGLNDSYFISNAYVINKLFNFEIFDRWGGKLFSTSDPAEEWDGRYQNEIVMSGVYIYKVEFECNGKTKVQSGSFTVLN